MTDEQTKSEKCKNDSAATRKGMTLGAGIGVALGAGIGAALGNVAIGAGIGVAIGPALGLLVTQSRKK